NAQSHTLKGDIKHEGPEIAEFKIDYYNEESSEEPKLFNITLEFLNQVKSLSNKDYSRDVAKNKLNNLIDELLDIIYVSS
ncbi:MAG: hypothetical protein ACXAD7_16360, partial [Candidatus Kariarchaeaceae archaeon]